MDEIISKSQVKCEFLVLEYRLDGLSQLRKGFPKTPSPNMALDKKKEEDKSIALHLNMHVFNKKRYNFQLAVGFHDGSRRNWIVLIWSTWPRMVMSLRICSITKMS
jgi:hypothetical protein